MEELREAGLEEMAGSIGMWLARTVRRVSEEEIVRVLGGRGSARVSTAEEGVYAVELYDSRGRLAFIGYFEEREGWVSPVVYMGHTIVDGDALRRLYEDLREAIRASRAG
ncbi:MAG: hypothetical protein ABWW70_01060 [Thermoproteota archaeon]